MKERAFSDGLLLGMARWDWRWWGNCGGVFWGVVGVGNGVDAGCEPTGTSALPGSALLVAGPLSVSNGKPNSTQLV